MLSYAINLAADSHSAVVQLGLHVAVAVALKADAWGGAKVALEWSLDNEVWFPFADPVELSAAQPAMERLYVVGIEALRARVTQADGVASSDAALQVSATSGQVLAAEIATAPAERPYAFRAYQSAAQSLAASTWTKVTLSTEVHDTDDVFDVALSRFQPTQAGWYQLCGRVRFTDNGAQALFAAVYLNGAVYDLGGVSRPRATGSVDLVCEASALVYLDGSDYVELWARQQSGASLNIIAAAEATNFAGIRIR